LGYSRYRRGNRQDSGGGGGFENMRAAESRESEQQKNKDKT
jgi:hypothetical protein